MKGNIIIAIIQGTIGGVTFWSLGVEAALLWGVLMTFLSMLPAVGAALVWVPAAAWFFASGEWVSGGILVFVGVFVIGLVDNLLRPPLVGKGTRMPDYVVLISTDRDQWFCGRAVNCCDVHRRMVASGRRAEGQGFRPTARELDLTRPSTPRWAVRFRSSCCRHHFHRETASSRHKSRTMPGYIYRTAIDPNSLPVGKACR